MNQGNSGPEDEALDGVMAAIYRQLDEHVSDTDVPYDIEAGLERLAGRMQPERGTARRPTVAAAVAGPPPPRLGEGSLSGREAVVSGPTIGGERTANARSGYRIAYRGIAALALATLVLIAVGGVPSTAANSAGAWLNAHYWAVLAPGLSAAAIGAVNVAWNRHASRRRLGWNLVWDQRINQDDPSAAPPRRASGDMRASRQRMWEIIYRPTPEMEYAQVPGSLMTIEQEEVPYSVREGSLVVMELRNTGRKPIVEADFTEQRKFTLKFPGRKVVHYKIRENDWYHDQVQDKARPVMPGVGDSFDLPALAMNPGDSFKLLVLLEGSIPLRTPMRERVEVQGTIVGGMIAGFDNRPHRWRWIAPLAAAVVVAGLLAGLRLGTGSQTPTAICASGQLTVAGSTAFAPVMNQVVTEYERYCPGAHITVSAVGSVQGLQELQARQGPMIAMYDGLPAQPVGPLYVSQPAGDIIFAIVGNRSLPSNVFEEGHLGGMTISQIEQAFTDPRASGFAAVGRSAASGTRQAFVRQVLGGNDSAEENIKPCPAVGGVAGTVCQAGTTMELLADVNVTHNAIGYAEADALPFFPNVSAIPINGYAPTRTNALDGKYAFVATEHLFTAGLPAGLTADLISFLKSAPVTAQLRATTSFIACADLAGSALSGDCQQ